MKLWHSKMEAVLLLLLENTVKKQFSRLLAGGPLGMAIALADVGLAIAEL